MVPQAVLQLEAPIPQASLHIARMTPEQASHVIRLGPEGLLEGSHIGFMTPAHVVDDVLLKLTPEKDTDVLELAGDEREGPGQISHAPRAAACEHVHAVRAATVEQQGPVGASSLAVLAPSRKSLLAFPHPPQVVLLALAQPLTLGRVAVAHPPQWLTLGCAFPPYSVSGISSPVRHIVSPGDLARAAPEGATLRREDPGDVSLRNLKLLLAVAHPHTQVPVHVLLPPPDPASELRIPEHEALWQHRWLQLRRTGAPSAPRTHCAAGIPLAPRAGIPVLADAPQVLGQGLGHESVHDGTDKDSRCGRAQGLSRNRHGAQEGQRPIRCSRAGAWRTAAGGMQALANPSPAASPIQGLHTQERAWRLLLTSSHINPCDVDASAGDRSHACAVGASIARDPLGHQRSTCRIQGTDP
mmetsp:Transcript_68643/g.154207  ORF Transcript_68643/g.154207 Transcript_68643/m.154207 type:complete len:413 (-) Transcript_68643:353-1591(-)